MGQLKIKKEKRKGSAIDMNKRQQKKAMKKNCRPLVDEMNLMTLSPKEYEDAMNEFKRFLWKNCRYYHYKDRHRSRACPLYHFPVGKSFLQRGYAK